MWGIFLWVLTMASPSHASSDLANYSFVIHTAAGETATTALSAQDLSVLQAGQSEMSESSAGSLDNPQIKSVFGDYPRTPVISNNTFPDRALGQLAVDCSGILVGPREVLTAGHCVYDVDEDDWEKDLAFSPGRNGSLLPQGSVDWQKVFVLKGWTEAHDDAFDIALVALKSAVGLKTGWASFAYDNQLQKQAVTIEGYPDDKPTGTLWTASCPLSAILPNSFQYRCDTYSGNSGSPIEILIKQVPVIFGVHTNGDQTINTGTRINAAIFHLLQKWKADNV